MYDILCYRGFFLSYPFNFMILLNYLIIDCLWRESTKMRIDKNNKNKLFFKPNLQTCCGPLIYLVFVCAWLELFELIVEHGELPSDALYPSMQTPVFAVLSVEIIFISLPLLRRVDHCILPVVNKEWKVWKKVVKHTKRKYFLTINNNTVWNPHSMLDTQQKYLYAHIDTIYFWILTINTLQLLLMMKTNYWCCCTFHSDLKHSFEINSMELTQMFSSMNLCGTFGRKRERVWTIFLHLWSVHHS